MPLASPLGSQTLPKAKLLIKVYCKENKKDSKMYIMRNIIYLMSLEAQNTLSRHSCQARYLYICLILVIFTVAMLFDRNMGKY